MPATRSNSVSARAPADPQALPPNGTFADLVLAVVATPNPQDDVRGQPGEKLLLDKICRWLEARKIKFEADVSWGIHAVLTGPGGAGSRPGLLLSAHLDSDHFRLGDLAALRVEGDKLVCPGQVGLDCKTGVAIILSALQRLQESASRMPKTWQVHVLFTVGEESGQKGAFRAPLPRLIAGKVRHAIVVDRMTSGAGAPRDRVTRAHVRHAVTSYKGVPLLDESGPELLEHLGRGLGAALGTNPKRLPTCESPNCADALELRGRHVAEVAAPQLLEALRAKGSALSPEALKLTESLEAATEMYRAATAEVAKRLENCMPAERVSGMNSPPRITRYQAMARVADAVARAKAGTDCGSPDLFFSCVNLSYDYDDDWDTCSLEELDLTVRILLGTAQSYFTSTRSAEELFK